MKRKKISLLQNLKISFFIYLGFHFSLWSQEKALQFSSLDESILTPKPLYEVASLGAPTSGFLVEGSIGSIQKSCRHRFYCHSANLTTGFLGSQMATKPISLKDQPGVFPAPLMGTDSITFNFICPDAHTYVIPVVVRPDGTVFQGLPMTAINSPQTLVISSPAQTGIYTLFVLTQQKDAPSTYVTVEASISKQPKNSKIFQLKSFEPVEKNAELVSNEFIYISP